MTEVKRTTWLLFSDDGDEQEVILAGSRTTKFEDLEAYLQVEDQADLDELFANGDLFWKEVPIYDIPEKEHNANT
jgi:hypothetical protein